MVLVLLLNIGAIIVPLLLEICWLFGKLLIECRVGSDALYTGCRGA